MGFSTGFQAIEFTGLSVCKSICDSCKEAIEAYSIVPVVSEIVSNRQFSPLPTGNRRWWPGLGQCSAVHLCIFKDQKKTIL